MAWVSVFVVVMAVALMVALQAFVRTTKTGKAMRATSQDPDTARLMGIDIDRIIVITFVLGAALAAVAGVMQGMRFAQIDFRIGFLAGLKAFTAAVLGGIGNITGAMLGGLRPRASSRSWPPSTCPTARRGRTCGPSSCSSLVLVFRPAGPARRAGGGPGRDRACRAASTGRP